MYKQFKYALLPGVIASTLALTACGGGGSGSGSPSTGEPIVTRGMITQLGSIWVNGVEYETPEGGTYTNDDSTSSTASYQVGQVVSIRGTRNDDGVSGTADEVEYEAEIEGAAGADNMINSVKIITDQTLTPGTRYEVSGFWIDNNNLQATFIKVDDDGDSDDEVKGFVEAFTANTITVRGVTYTYSGTPVVAINDYVEIHFNGTVANEVELEDDFFDDVAEGQEVEFQGGVNLDVTGCPAGADFKIDATCIDWDSVVEWSDGLTGPADMVAGLRVEAEGYFSGDLLVAEKIKGRGNEVRISSIGNNIVDSSGSGSLDVFSGAIQVTYEAGLTEIEFNEASTISAADNGEGFEIRGIRTGPTSVLALRIKDENVGDNDHELRAEVDIDGADSGNDTITLMGITSMANSSTELEIEDTVIAPGNGLTTQDQINSFLDGIDDDDIISTTNGPRDIIEVRIDVSSGDGSTSTPYTAREIEIELEDD